MARRRGAWPHLFVDSRLATDGLDRLVQPPTEILQYHRSSLLRDRVDEREQQSRFLHTINLVSKSNKHLAYGRTSFYRQVDCYLELIKSRRKKYIQVRL